MMGWRIIVKQQMPCEEDGVPEAAAIRLASWETGNEGLAWLERLAESGTASRMASGDDFTRYLATARDVLPLLADLSLAPTERAERVARGIGHAPDALQAAHVVIDQALLQACAPGQLLAIEAWNLERLTKWEWLVCS